MDELEAMECKFPALLPEQGEELNIANAQVSIELPSTDFQSWLHDFCGTEDVSVPDVFLALWGLILKTFTGHGAVCAGSVFKNELLELVSAEVDEQATMIELIRSLAKGKRTIQDITLELPCNSAVSFANTKEEIPDILNKVSEVKKSCVMLYTDCVLVSNFIVSCGWTG